jgi:hypothetical protein
LHEIGHLPLILSASALYEAKEENVLGLEGPGATKPSRYSLGC